jgi:ankyrin repeat protein
MSIMKQIRASIELDDLERFCLIMGGHGNSETHDNDDGEKLLNYAIKNRSERILHYLLNKKQNLNFKDENNSTPLHLAIEQGMCEIVEKIIDYCIQGPELNSNSEGNTELHLWVLHHSNCENCLKKLYKIKKLRNLNDYFLKKNNRGYNALHTAVLTSSLNCVKHLISGKYFSFNIHDTDENKNSLLHLSVLSKDYVSINIKKDVFNYIQRLNNFNIDQKNLNMQTPLNLALMSENFRAAESLIDSNANVSINDKRIAFEVS